MPDHTVCCARTSADGYCVNCDLLVGLPGVRVVAVAGGRQRLTVTVESPRGPMGCPACGVVAVSHGRRTHVLIDTPCFGRPVRLHWRKRTWSCPEPACAVGTFTERAEDVAAPRALLLCSPLQLVHLGWDFLCLIQAMQPVRGRLRTGPVSMVVGTLTSLHHRGHRPGDSGTSWRRRRGSCHRVLGGTGGCCRAPATHR